MPQWQAEVTFPGGSTLIFGLAAEHEDEAWELAADQVPATMPAPENLEVTEIAPLCARHSVRHECR